MKLVSPSFLFSTFSILSIIAAEAREERAAVARRWEMEQKKDNDRYALAQQRLKDEREEREQRLKDEREEREREREERAEVRKHEREILLLQLQLAKAGGQDLPDSRG